MTTIFAIIAVALNVGLAVVIASLICLAMVAAIAGVLGTITVLFPESKVYYGHYMVIENIMGRYYTHDHLQEQYAMWDEETVACVRCQCHYVISSSDANDRAAYCSALCEMRDDEDFYANQSIPADLQLPALPKLIVLDLDDTTKHAWLPGKTINSKGSADVQCIVFLIPILVAAVLALVGKFVSWFKQGLDIADMKIKSNRGNAKVNELLILAAIGIGLGLAFNISDVIDYVIKHLHMIGFMGCVSCKGTGWLNKGSEKCDCQELINLCIKMREKLGTICNETLEIRKINNKSNGAIHEITRDQCGDMDQLGHMINDLTLTLLKK